jgi:hypothetical protein
VNPPAAFVGRDALNPMPTGFRVEAFAATAREGQCKKGVAVFKVRAGDTGMLSADAIGVAEVGVGQFGSEQTGVAAPFGRTEFDLTHGNHGNLRR